MATAALAVVAVAGEARAQELVLGANLGGGTGIEGGDPGSGEMRFRRARSRIVGQLEMRMDEDKKNGLGFVVFAEIEPAASVGGSFRYLRWLSPNVYGFAGLTGVGAPRTLLGGEVGVQIQIPIDKTLSLFLEPSFAALPLGTDLPQDHVLIWGLFTLGIHANL
jgi:hypothetical protein